MRKDRDGEKKKGEKKKKRRMGGGRVFRLALGGVGDVGDRTVGKVCERCEGASCINFVL